MIMKLNGPSRLLVTNEAIGFVRSNRLVGELMVDLNRDGASQKFFG